MDGTFPQMTTHPVRPRLLHTSYSTSGMLPLAVVDPAWRGKKRKRGGENRGVMMDGSSPSLPAPPTDNLFSLPQLSFLPPSPFLSFLPPSLLVLLSDSCVSEGDTSNTRPGVCPPKNTLNRFSRSPLRSLHPSSLELLFTQYGLAGQRVSNPSPPSGGGVREQRGEASQG